MRMSPSDAGPSKAKQKMRLLASAVSAAFSLMVAATLAVPVAALAGSETTYAATDDVERGQLVIYKYDAETKASAPQGGGNLDGAEFAITNNSEKEIVYIDEYGHKTTVSVGESFVIKSVYDKALGAYVAKTPVNGLPYGTYNVKEVNAGQGYGLMSDSTLKSHPYIQAYVLEDSELSTLLVDGSTTQVRWVDQGYDFSIRHEGQTVVFGNDAYAGDATLGGKFTVYNRDSVMNSDAMIVNAGPGCFNPVVRGGIEVVKRDHDLLRSYAQGDAVLENVKYTIYNDNQNDIILWDHFDNQHGVVGANVIGTDADENGVVKPGEIVATIYGDANGTAQTFMDALPAGWYKVVESAAPAGYTSENAWVSNVQITNGDWDHNKTTTCDDPVITGTVTIRKYDDQTSGGEAQGNATLEGAHVLIYNYSYSTSNSGDVWIPAQDYNVANPEAHRVNTLRYYMQRNEVEDWQQLSSEALDACLVGEYVTGPNGTVDVSDLPYGSYVAIEKSASEGYLVNASWMEYFKIDGSGKASVSLPETVKTGSIEVNKFDADSGEARAQGGATLAGAVIDVYLAGEEDAQHQDIVYNGTTYHPGELVTQISTNALGVATVEGLPYAKYRLVESSAPVGYICLTKDEWNPLVELNESSSYGTVTMFDYVKRYDLEFTKRVTSTNQPLSNVAFLVRSRTTGESHIFVTDSNGFVTTDANRMLHSFETNSNDPAYTESGVNDDLLDAICGYYFWGYSEGVPVGSEMENMDSRGALPYDDYDIIELTCAANTYPNVPENQKMASQVVNMTTANYPNSYLLNIGTIDNADFPAPPQSGITSGAVKTADVPSTTIVGLNDVINYTITYTNTEGESGKDYVIRDYIGDSVEYVDGSMSEGGVYVPAENSDNGHAYVEWVFNEIAKGETVNVSFGVRVVAYGETASPLPYISNFAYAGYVQGTGNAAGSALCPSEQTNAVVHGTVTLPPAYVYGQKTSDKPVDQELNVGDQVTYSVTLTNNGGQTSDAFSIFDSIPDGMALTTTPGADDQPVYQISEGGAMVGDYGVGWNNIVLEPGQSATYWFTCVVTEDAMTTVSNTATFGISSGVVVGDLPSRTNTVTHTVKANLDITAEKSAYVESGSNVVRGEIITYNLHVVNNGRGSAYNVPVFDMIPENTQFVAGSMKIDGVAAPDLCVEPTDDAQYCKWTIPYLIRKGGAADVSFQVRVRSDVEYGATVTNTGYVGGVVPAQGTLVEGSLADLEEQIASNTTEHYVVDAMGSDTEGFEIWKSADPESGSYVAPGEEITYTISWTNNTGHAINGFAVRDEVPAGTTLKQGSIVVVGADGVSSTEKQEAARDDAANNEQNIEGTSTGSSTTINTGSVVWTYEGAVNGADVMAVYNAVVTNPETQTFADWDTVQAYLSTASAGDWIEFTIQDSATYNIRWKAVVEADGRIALYQCKMVDGSELGSVNYAPGNGIYGNYDPAHNTVYALQDVIYPGETGSVSFTVVVNDDVEANQDIVNRYTYGDGVYGDPTEELPHQGPNETVHHVGMSDLVGTKYVTPEGDVKQGDVLTYTVEVTNNGNATAYGVGIYDELFQTKLTGVVYVPGSASVEGGNAAELNEGYLATLGALTDSISVYSDYLAPGETLRLTFDVHVIDVAVGDVVVNKATYGEGLPDRPIGPLDKETNETQNNVVEPSVHIEKTSIPTNGDTVCAGDTIEYIVKIINDSDVTATNVAMYDAIPTYCTLIGSSIIPDGLVSTGNAVAKGGMSIEPGDAVELHFTVRVNADTAEGTVINNRATWGYSATTPMLPMDVDSNEVAHQVVAPDVAISIESHPVAGSVVGPGDEITYTVTAKNNGLTPAKSVGLYSDIPYGTTYKDSSLIANGGCVDEAGRYVSALVGDIAPGASATMTFTAIVGADTEGVVTADGSWGYGLASAPTIKQVNVTEAIHHEVAASQVQMLITQTPATGSLLSPGATINYQIAIYNTSNASVANIGIYDAIPEGAVYLPNTLSTFGISESQIVYDFMVGNGESGEGGSISTDVMTEEEKAELIANATVEGISARIDRMESGDVAYINFSVKAEDGFAGVLHNTPTWQAGCYTCPTSNCVNVGNDVVAEIDMPMLEIVKTQYPASGSLVSGGDVLTYTTVVKNVGKTTAKNVGVYDEAPKHTQYVVGSLAGYKTSGSSTTSVDAYVSEDGLLSVMGGDIAPGETVTLVQKVTIDYGYVGKIHSRSLWVSPAPAPLGELQGVVAEPEVLAGREIESESALGALDDFAGSLGDGAQSGWSNDTADPDTPDTPDNPDAPDQPGDKPGDNEGGNEGGNTGDNTGDNPGDNPEDNPGGNEGGSTNEGDVSGTTPDPDEPNTGDGSDKGNSNEVDAEVKDVKINLSKSSDLQAGSYVTKDQVIKYTIKAENLLETNANGILIADWLPEGLEYVDGTLAVNRYGKDDAEDNHEVTAAEQVAIDKAKELLSVKSWMSRHELYSSLVSQGVDTNAAAYAVDHCDADYAAFALACAKKLVEDGKCIIDVDLVGKLDKGAYDELIDMIKAYGFDSIEAEGAAYTLYKEAGADMSVIPSKGITAGDDGITEDNINTTVRSFGSYGYLDLVCGFYNIAAGETIEITFDAKVTLDDPEGVRDLTNVAYWQQTPNPDSKPEESNKSEIYQGNPHVVLLKSATVNGEAVTSGSLVNHGDEITYTLTVENHNDHGEFINVMVEDAIPAGCEFVSSEDMTYDEEANKVYREVAQLEAGKGVSMSFTVRVNDLPAMVAGGIDATNIDEYTGKIEGFDADDGSWAANVSKWLNDHLNGVFNSGDDNLVNGSDGSLGVVMDEGHIINTAWWHYTDDSADKTPNPSDNTIDLTHPNLPVKVTKTAQIEEGSVVKPGNTITYDITVENPGYTLAFVELTEKMPQGLSFVEATAGGINEESGAWNYRILLAPHTTKTVSVTCTVTDDAEGSIVNTVGVLVNGDPKADVSDAGCSVETTSHNVELAKSATVENGGVAGAGDEVYYAIAIRNGEEYAISNVLVEDNIPEGTEYIEGSARLLDQAGNVIAQGDDALTRKVNSTSEGADEHGHVTVVRAFIESLAPVAEEVGYVPTEAEAYAAACAASLVQGGYSYEDTMMWLTSAYDCDEESAKWGADEAFGYHKKEVVDGDVYATLNDDSASATLIFGVRVKDDASADKAIVANTAYGKVGAGADEVIDDVANAPLSSNEHNFVLSADQTDPKDEFELVKSASAPRVAMGSSVTYVLDLYNNSADGASNVVIDDVMPDGMTVLPGSVAVIDGDGNGVEIPGGALTISEDGKHLRYVANVIGANKGEEPTKIFSIKFMAVAASVEADYSTINIANWAADVDSTSLNDGSEITFAEGSNECVVDVVAADDPGMQQPTGHEANFKLEKSATDADGKAIASGSVLKTNDVIKYSIKLSSVNADSVPEGIEIYDTLPESVTYVEDSERVLDAEGNVIKDAEIIVSKDDAGRVTISYTTAALETEGAGAICTLTFDAKVSGVEKDTNVVNTAAWAVGGKKCGIGSHNFVVKAASGNANVPNQGGNTEVKDNSYKLTKTASVTKWASEGDQITYQITIANNTPNDVYNMYVYDIMPAGLSYVSSTNGFNAYPVEQATQTVTGYKVERSLDAYKTEIEWCESDTGKAMLGQSAFASANNLRAALSAGQINFSQDQIEACIDYFFPEASKNAKAVYKVEGNNTYRFTISSLKSGETKTFQVVCKVNNFADGDLTNQAQAYVGDKVVASAQCTVAKASAQEAALAGAGKDLPQTGQVLVAGILCLVAALAVVGGVYFYRRRQMVQGDVSEL